MATDYLRKMVSQKAVTPAKAGVQRSRNILKRLDSGFRRNDEKHISGLFASASSKTFGLFG
jgi:hypothetical protein